MAKKFGKFLLFTAAAGAAGAAAYYYLRKKDTGFWDETDEDYDDFSEDMEDETPSRTYVPLNHDDTAAPDSDSPESAAGDDDNFTPLTEQVSQVTENVINKAEEAVESTEEFFDDAD